MPLLSTNRMPVRAARLSRRGLPPLGLGGSSGNSGSTISQSSSLTNSLAILLPYPDSAVLKGSLSLSHLCVLTQGTLLTFTGESAPQVPLMLLVPPLPIAYVGLRRPTFPRRPAQARTQNWPG